MKKFQQSKLVKADVKQTNLRDDVVNNYWATWRAAILKIVEEKAVGTTFVLKHRRFWATDVNRNSKFLLFDAYYSLFVENVKL